MAIEFKTITTKGVEKNPRTLIRQVVPNGHHDPLTVESSSGGVTIHGRLLGQIENEADLNALAKAIGDGYTNFIKAKTQLRRTLMGG